MVAEFRAALGGEVEILVGEDGAASAGIAAGATGWVSALANVLPGELSTLLHLERARDPRAGAVREWLDPLLAIAARPDAVQALKRLQEEIGHGSARVRPPRLPLPAAEGERIGRELRAVLAGSPLGREHA
jgi:4-hydroxy-tetrahydrodipicolinate synthase